MAVYVDDPVWPWRGMLWGHLTADTLDELHGFACFLGLKKEWYQYPKTRFPHYDLMLSKHKVALRNGAVLVPTREIIQKCKVLRNAEEVEYILHGAPTTGRGSRGRGRH